VNVRALRSGGSAEADDQVRALREKSEVKGKGWKSLIYQKDGADD
jgi:hypothetical protein